MDEQDRQDGNTGGRFIDNVGEPNLMMLIFWALRVWLQQRERCHGSMPELGC